MCFSMEEFERLKAIVEERKKLREQLKDLKPSDFEKKEEKEEKKEPAQVRG